MVWGWLVASVFILFVGMSMAELGSAAPTSGGVSTYLLCITRECSSSPNYSLFSFTSGRTPYPRPAAETFFLGSLVVRHYAHHSVFFH